MHSNFPTYIEFYYDEDGAMKLRHYFPDQEKEITVSHYPNADVLSFADCSLTFFQSGMQNGNTSWAIVYMMHDSIIKVKVGDALSHLPDINLQMNYAIHGLLEKWLPQYKPQTENVTTALAKRESTKMWVIDTAVDVPKVDLNKGDCEEPNKGYEITNRKFFNNYTEAKEAWDEYPTNKKGDGIHFFLARYGEFQDERGFTSYTITTLACK